jgi:protein tyrosine/serine phosphatase
MERKVIIIPKLPRGSPGPTPTSHYVLDNLIAGAYPGDSESDTKQKEKLKLILDQKVTTFVSLIHDSEMEKFRPYEKMVMELNQQVKCLRFGIKDGKAPSEELLEEILFNLNSLLEKGEKVYLHCWGGHSRTGTVICMLLARMFKLPFEKALKLTYQLHKKRLVQSGGHSKKQVLSNAQLKLVKSLLT